MKKYDELLKNYLTIRKEFDEIRQRYDTFLKNSLKTFPIDWDTIHKLETEFYKKDEELTIANNKLLEYYNENEEERK